MANWKTKTHTLLIWSDHTPRAGSRAWDDDISQRDREQHIDEYVGTLESIREQAEQMLSSDPDSKSGAAALRYATANIERWEKADAKRAAAT